MEKSAEKRVRGANFSVGEKTLLLNLVYKYRDVIEDKRTDGSSLKEKKKTWEKVCSEFNAACPNVQNRNAESLQNFYKNKKKELRQATAQEKTYLKKTGGGPPLVTKTESTDELLLSIMNKKTVEGLQNEFDSDALQLVEPSVSTKDPEIVYEIDQEKENYDVTQWPNEEHENTRCGQQLGNKHTAENLNHNDEKIYNKREERQNTEAVLEEEVARPTEQRRTFDKTRRRPATVVKALTTSELSQKYNMLVTRRLEVAELQKQVLNQSINQSIFYSCHYKKVYIRQMEISLILLLLKFTPNSFLLSNNTKI